MNFPNLVIAVAVGLLLGSAAALGEMAAHADIHFRGKGYNGAMMPNQAAGTGQRQISIDDQAFADTRGAVQLNQSAGAGNHMVNSLGMRIMY
ncbi:MAG: hypothetical protein R6V43_05275 [Halopseudomonas sp.]